MADYSRDIDIGKTTSSPSTLEVLQQVVGTDLTDTKNATEELVGRLGSLQTATELILGQEVDD